MRKVVKEYNIYKYDELSDDVKQKVYDEWKQKLNDDFCEWELELWMDDEADILLEEYFGKNVCKNIKCLYDLSYSQGCGAMVEFDINIKDLNNKYKIFTDDEIEFLSQKDVYCDIRVRHSNSSYYHEYTFNIDYDYYNEWDFDDIKEDFNITESEFATLEDRFYKLVDDSDKHHNESPFVKDIIEINRKLVRYGYDCIEGCPSDEDLLNLFSDMEFYESGEVF